ncbi:coniferyl-alcohol dehydrogenase [Calothrix sp. FACHB-1219]|uniref:coniferyl-alcohol dehydrogenase n=1 Tax=Calothrix sp. FACHB-1219 TaxID=2692778 RepID=UPI001689290E|nr:coniferyl-alcohol dehydrogenase [Calothrix sp. FACHB-1219]
MMQTKSFANTTIVVTGASSGIGKRTSELLLADGAKVIALDRNAPSYEVSQYIPVDLSDQASIDAAVFKIKGEQLHGLCNIAGVPGTVPDDVVARVNYLGLRHLTTSLLPQVTPGGAIVNIASIAGMKWRDHAEKLVELARVADWTEAQEWISRHEFLRVEAYRRYKEALVVWSQTMAGEWVRRYGVRMNCVSPGPVDTPILEDFKESLGRKGVNDLIDMTGRAGTPADIAPAVVFLLSDAAKWVVGVDLTVDGGLNAMRFAATYPVTA